MRVSKKRRKTKETNVTVRINLDGKGRAKISTGIKFLDHLLESFAKHGSFDLEIKSSGDLPHHIAEDTMIVLGEAIREALGNKAGIARMGDAIVPMDDALVMAAIDLSGRAYPSIAVRFKGKKVEGLSSDLIVHLLQSLAVNAGMNLHVEVMRGVNDHHKAEAIFKAVGVALSKACRKSRKGRDIPSTKGRI